MTTTQTAPHGEQPAIEADGVGKWFGATRALDGVSFTIAPGETRALLGRNGAGKSTLVSLITGIAAADEGRLLVSGDHITGHDSRIGCVYQRSSLIPAFSAAENVLLQQYPRRRGGVIHWSRIQERARDLLGRWEIGHLADTPVELIEPIHRKVVEICRAMVTDPAVLILDEPTAGLDRHETARLFQLLAGLRDRGTTVLYITHHLEDVFQVCDSVTVLRDARHIMTRRIGEVTMTELVAAIVGDHSPAAAAERVPHERSTEIVAEVRDLRTETGVGPVDLVVHEGECVGIAGLDGSGKVDLARALAGLTARTGSVAVRCREVPAGDVPAAVEAGIGFVPEDRHFDGMVPPLDVSENATMTVAHRLARSRRRWMPRISRRADRDRVYGALADQWRIGASSPRQPISELSGGNQQKCVMARAIAADPDLLVLVNPTAGVDVSAKASIVASLGQILRKGAGLLVVSEDADDFVLCDRVLVMVKGRLVTTLEPGWTEATLVAAMQGAEQ